MADNFNLADDERKNTKPYQKAKILVLLLVLALGAAFLIIYQKVKMEEAKDAQNKKQSDSSVESQRTDPGSSLESLIMGLHSDREKRRPSPVMVSTPDKRQELPIVVPVKQEPVKIYVQAPKQKEIAVPDEEMVKLGANLRQSKVLAIQSPSYVGGFAKEQPSPQSPNGTPAASQYNGSAASAAAGSGGNAGNNYSGNLNDLARGMIAQDPNKQSEKQNFLYSKGSELTPQGYSSNIPIPQQFPLELKAGTIIPGIMISGINSDLPGSVIGQVSEHVYDTASGKNILIPKGSRLIGAYDSEVTYGQRRVGVVWNRVIAPNGTTLNISGSQGMDRAGYSGMPGKIDEHWGKLVSAALLASVFVGGAELLSPSINNNSNNNSKSARDVIAESVATTALEIGGRLLDKASNIQPTIKIRPGARFNVFVAQDVVFPHAW